MTEGTGRVPAGDGVRERVAIARGAVVNGVGTLPQRVRRDFSRVDHDEAIRRARDIVPLLRERAQRSEETRILLRENEQLLHETGLFRYHQPRAFGGMELSFVAVVDHQSALLVQLRYRRRGVWASGAGGGRTQTRRSEGPGAS
jgi:hypothetical protein